MLAPLNRNILQRAAVCVWLLACVAGVLPAQAPSQRARAPRAIALVEITSAGGATLVPVLVRDNGRFFDANLYRATPEPMALENETFYDVLRAGELAGTFTVEGAAKRGQQWVGTGRWRPLAAQPAGEISLAKPGAAVAGDDEDKPPVLRRPGTAQSGNEDAKAAPHANAPQQPATPAATAAAEDPDRPRLRREAGQQVTVNERDKQSVVVKETLVAISDVNPGDYRPWDFTLGDAERAGMMKTVRSAAQNAVAKFVAARAALRGAKLAPLTNETMRALDLTLSNDPVAVYSATVPSDRGEFWVTVVVRVAAAGESRTLLASVTAPAYLDSLPRLELIDAVDAEGTGRAQLLFRATSGAAQHYILYRATAHELFPLAETVPVRR